MIACVRMPHFAVQVERLAAPALNHEAIVLLRYSGRKGTVYAACPQAFAEGVRPGLSASRARALCPDAQVLLAAPGRCRRAAESLLEQLSRYSQWLEVNRFKASGQLAVVYVDLGRLRAADGLAVLAVDVNASQSRCTLEQGAIRLGFNYVKGMGSAAGEQIAAARAGQPFGDLADFCRRTRLPRLLVERLIQAGACDAWGSSRRTLLWTLGALGAVPDALGLVYDPEPVALPELSAAEAAGMEYAVTGLSLGAHPLTVYRERLRARGVLDSAALRAAADGQQVQVAGLLVVHQAPPTAKGHHFLTLEDEHGFINVILRPRVYARYRRVVRSTPLLLVSGQVQQRGAVVNVIARHVRGVAQ